MVGISDKQKWKENKRMKMKKKKEDAKMKENVKEWKGPNWRRHDKRWSRNERKKGKEWKGQKWRRRHEKWWKKSERKKRKNVKEKKKNFQIIVLIITEIKTRKKVWICGIMAIVIHTYNTMNRL